MSAHIHGVGAGKIKILVRIVGNQNNVPGGKVDCANNGIMNDTTLPKILPYQDARLINKHFIECGNNFQAIGGHTQIEIKHAFLNHSLLASMPARMLIGQTLERT